MTMQSKRIFSIGNRYLIAYLTFLSSFAPLSTDMYLPALPAMAENLATSDELVSYSMTSFFLIYALSTLFWGPLSDKYGRRLILLAGSAIYILSCLVIALTDSIWMLLMMRGLQAIGCAAASAMSLAIIKDVLRGQFMEKIVSFMQAAHVLAPMCAPVIGGAMLYFVDWRGVFWVQALCGLLALCGAFCLRETARNKQSLSLGESFLRIRLVLGNAKFRRPFILFSAMAMPFMAYLAVSSFVYQVQFGLSPQAFSLFFALNAAVSLGAPLAHVYCFSRSPKRRLISLELLIMTISGFAMVFLASLNAWLFALLMLPLTFCGSAMRPPSTVILMEAHPHDNGTVAALIQCGGLLFASFSMFLAALDFWPNPVFAIGLIASFTSLACFLAWQKIKTSA